jgi:hypothetical protein
LSAGCHPVTAFRAAASQKFARQLLESLLDHNRRVRQ